MLQGRSSHAVMRHKDDIYVFGGAGQGSLPLKHSEFYSLVAENWTELPQMPKK
jgi:hypothetical protein